MYAMDTSLWPNGTNISFGALKTQTIKNIYREFNQCQQVIENLTVTEHNSPV
jgi:hypothetical protein